MSRGFDPVIRGSRVGAGAAGHSAAVATETVEVRKLSGLLRHIIYLNALYGLFLALSAYRL